MFIPGGGLVQLFMTGFKMVQFVVQEGSRIAALASSIIGGVANIAQGNIGGAVASGGVGISNNENIPEAEQQKTWLSKLREAVSESVIGKSHSTTVTASIRYWKTTKFTWGKK